MVYMHPWRTPPCPPPNLPAPQTTPAVGVGVRGGGDDGGVGQRLEAGLEHQKRHQLPPSRGPHGSVPLGDENKATPIPQGFYGNGRRGAGGGCLDPLSKPRGGVVGGTPHPPGNFLPDNFGQTRTP